VVQITRGRAPWSKYLKKIQFRNLFLGKDVFLGNSRSMNPMVPLDWGDLFPYKIYGHLRGWSTSVDLSHDVLDLGCDVLDLGYDVLDLGYDVLDLGYDVLDLGYDVLDLGYDVLDLGYDVLDLGYDVVDLGYDVLDKNKKVRGRGSRQIF
jgi:hypothetical protein